MVVSAGRKEACNSDADKMGDKLAERALDNRHNPMIIACVHAAELSMGMINAVQCYTCAR